MDFHYKCIDCGAEYSREKMMYLCPQCSAERSKGEFQKGVLQVILDSEQLRKLNRTIYVDPSVFSPLPVFKPELYPVGNTPLIVPDNLRVETAFKNLYIKDDGKNPSGSLKDRASQLVASQAIVLGENRVSLASTGNAGSAMACAGASYGLDIVLFVPSTAPPAKLLQSVIYGANVIPINGTYDDAFRLSIEFTNAFGGVNRNTAYNPFTIEGKKSVSVEIYNQLNGNAPDIVYVPVGDGVIYAGVYKGFLDMMRAGFIEQIPRIIGVQSSGSNAIYRAYRTGQMLNIKEATTAADSISVASPANGRMVTNYLESCHGWMTEVSDEEILDAQLQLGREAGIFAEPAAATAWAGFIKDKDKLDKEQTVVILVTGTGFKDVRSFEKSIRIPQSIDPNIDEVKRVLCM